MGIEARGELADKLRKLGVETVTAEYNGHGDDGQIETPEFGSSIVPHETASAVEYLFYELLEELYSGWENNEGGFGTFSWDVKADKIDLVHNTCFESHETEERTL
jgi:hypothetical protein